jgi:maintenance of morphology protein 1
MSFFTPTFTQGLILGQLSILVLLGFILKYLFLDNSPRDADGFRTVPTPPFQSQTLQQNPNDIDSKEALDISVEGGSEMELESAEWFNALLEQVSICHEAVLQAPNIVSLNVLAGIR